MVINYFLEPSIPSLNDLMELGPLFKGLDLLSYVVLPGESKAPASLPGLAFLGEVKSSVENREVSFDIIDDP